MNGNGKEMTPAQAAVYIVVTCIVFLALLALLVWAYACGCPRIARANMVHPYNADRAGCSFTPMGACLILNNNVVSDNYFLIIDDRITATEACLKSWYAERDDVLHRVYNWKAPARSCYVIILVDDWTTSCDGEWQLFGSAPQESCNQKGFEADPDCPCKFRGALQNGSDILIPPDAKFLRIEVVELLTGFRSMDIWDDSSLVHCGGF